MEWLMFHLDQIASTDTATVAILTLIAGTCVAIIRNALAVPALSLLLFPMIVGFGLVADYLLRTQELFIQNKVDQWAVQVIAAGTIAAVLSIGIMSLCGKAMSRTRTKTTSAQPA